MKKIYLSLFFNSLFIPFGYAQLNIGAKTQADQSAVLQISPNLSTTRRAFLPPKLTSAEISASAFAASTVPGLLVYNTTLNRMQVNTGVTGSPIWTEAGGNIYSGDGTLISDRVVTTGSNALSFLGTGDISFNNTGLKFGTATSGTSVSNSRIRLIMDNSYSTNIAKPKVQIITTPEGVYGLNATPSNSVLFGNGAALIYQAGSGASHIWTDGTIQMSLTAGGTFTARTSFTQSSDRRLKSNIKDLEYGIQSVMAMQPKRYDIVRTFQINNGVPVVNDSNKAPVNDIGFIAQELYKVIPEAVKKPKDEANEIWTVSLLNLVPVLTKAIQQQQQEIKDLNLKSAELKALDNLNGKEIDALIKRLNAVMKANKLPGSENAFHISKK